MKNTTGRLLTLFLMTVLTATGLSVPALAQPPDGDIRARIEAIPGMRVLGERPATPGQVVLDLTYRQPTDHRHADQGSFDQRLTLVHKSTQRPMVLYSSGYDLGSSPNRMTEPAQLLDANQITTEQRFFGTSRPEDPDWSKLTIWQAASDHHRLITALKTMYHGAWISTGGSKGGMTAVYHRRFYPDDVAGTVAYSAPNNTDDRDDTAYDARLEQVGTTECRAAIKSAQRDALIRREAMTERYARWAEGEKKTFGTIGSVDRAFELAVVRLPMMFWMHQSTDGCASIPTSTATDDALYLWVAKVTQLPVYTDQTVESFTPYFYQLGTQLGYPQFATPYLDGLLRYPGIQEIRTYVPRDIPLRFQPAAMADIDRWVRRHGSSLMFVNGENDIAVAEHFRPGNGTYDSYLFNVPDANHHISITGLRPNDAEQATAALRRWAGQTETAAR
ncbi:S28 family serine protease [Streptomyces sp. NBC_01294]|uniref:S28 family serine protease n=1 Tax=Streptomyces sp. NBC_01294 TaxID=2903815 RepID=UPI002DD8788F|nr:S28 family serine protease [Streptomyces sp. NBC_01294]WRZ55165.1 aminopeptidase [Streptomyces sp. NBC_01294]WRZ61535.1 aminopeptidase [Streptomyces sp. NBC_01294]